MFFLIDGERTECDFASFVQMGDVYCLFVVGTGFGEAKASALDNLNKLTDFESQYFAEHIASSMCVCHQGGMDVSYEITHIETTSQNIGYIDCVQTDMIFCTLKVLE